MILFLTHVGSCFRAIMAQRELKSLLARQNDSDSGRGAGLFRRLFRFIPTHFRSDPRVEAVKSEIAGLQKDIRCSEEMSRCIFVEISDLHVAKQQLMESRTPKGRFYNYLGIFFSGYCVYKMVMSCLNIVLQRVRDVDPITRGLQLFLQYSFHYDIDTRFWSQQLSFVFVGILVGTQFRGFLIELTKAFNAWSSVINADFTILVLAEVMGMYFVSSVLLMRMNLPMEYRVLITEVLGDLEFTFYFHWFDLLFLISATVSIGKPRVR